MRTTLHVLNGDATLKVFERTSLDGDILVWREVLSEGPVSENIEATVFWKDRSDFICQTFGETPGHYNNSVVIQLEKLNTPYEEINLWFEFDLHCQVNLLGVMQLLSSKSDLSGPEVYLICPSEVPDIEDFRGMGQLTAEQLEDVYDNVRVQLSEYDFKLVAEAWQLYVAGDTVKLEGWLNATTFWGNMPCLKPALQAHLKRLQKNADGLTFIEQTLLDIYNSGIHNKPGIYMAFWNNNQIYGMGDSELDIYLDKLTNRGLINL